MKSYRVLLIEDAENDLFEIFKWIANTDSRQQARAVLDGLRDTCGSLEKAAERGHLPPELERIAVTGYREIHYKPYRIIYEIEKREVYIHCVVHGRRDLQSILERRLLR